MTKHRTLILAALVALSLALAGAIPVAVDAGTTQAAASRSAPAEAGTPTSLIEVLVVPDGEGRKTVTLSGDGPFEYESFELADPDRVVVDLKNVVSRLPSHHVPVGESGVLRVRAGQFRMEPVPVSRIVFDLDQPVPYRIGRQDDRLVVSFGEPAHEVAAAGDAEGTPPSEPESPAGITEAPLPRMEETASSQATERASREEAKPEAAAPAPRRSLEPAALERLLLSPALAAEVEPPSPASGFETRTIAAETRQYTGKKISLNLVDADIKQVFRLFHEISGLNFVLDPSVEGRVTIVLDNVPWDQALDIILTNNGLDKTYENNVVRIATTQKLAQEAASRKQLKEAKELEVEPITITRTLSYAKAKDVERVIRDGGILSARGRVIVDERTNTLIISDIGKKVDPLDELITTLDSETPQVMIEARIVETSRTFVQDLGIVWGMTAIADASRGTATGLSFPHNASVRYGLNLPGGGAASNLQFRLGNIVDSFTLDVALNTLETEGRGRILSSPKIATQNNERAEIEQGVRIPVVSTTATEINVEFVSASLRLSVTPQITAEGTIILDIQVENNSPDFTRQVQATPPINTQRAQTKVLITDGGTTVIGGIFTVNEARSESGVPWFRKLPVLGWLFKNRSISNENRELLIFITPKIMRIG